MPEWRRAGATPTKALRALLDAKLAGSPRVAIRARGRVRADAVDTRQQRGDVVLVDGIVDAPLEPLEPRAQRVDVLAEVGHLQLVGLAVMSTHRDLGTLDELSGKLPPDRVAAAVAQAGQFPLTGLRKGGGRRIAGEQRSRLGAAHVVDEATKLGESEVHCTVQLPDAVAQVLRQPVAQMDQLAQLFAQLGRKLCRLRPLLRQEPSD